MANVQVQRFAYSTLNHKQRIITVPSSENDPYR